jgi:hypothetical protein
MSELTCAACGAPIDGAPKHAIHRDGPFKGPEVPLCADCGDHPLPSCNTLWDEIARRIRRGVVIQTLMLIFFIGCSTDTFVDPDAAADSQPPFDARVEPLGDALVDASVDSPTTGSDASDASAPKPYKRVFITSSTTLSNFGGLAQGDAICNTAAASAGLGGTFAAWLSTSSQSAASRLSHSTLPYVLVDGTTEVAANWTALTSGTFENLIDHDEHGALVQFNLSTMAGTSWTGTNADGTQTNVDCGGWTISEDCSMSTAHTGTIGRDDLTAYWTNWAAPACCNVQSYALYCIEQ